jgi:RNA polymerase sigma-B factor
LDSRRPSATLHFDDRAERTAELFARLARTTCPEEQRSLRSEIVVLNVGVARAIARRFADKGEPLSDLEQTAMVGLTKAVHRFDIRFETTFLSFAVPTITGELKRYFRDFTWTIRPPRRIQDLHQQVTRYQSRASQILGHAPTHQEVAAELGSTVGQVEEAIGARNYFSPQSIDSAWADSPTLADALAGSDADFAEADARMMLRPLLATLTPRERVVLELRFWHDCTQQEIADAIGATQMQVSRQLARTLQKLRQQLDNEERAS